LAGGCVGLSAALVPFGIIEYLISLSTKKEIKKTSSELEKLKEDYNFSRGYD
jgi:hypothetical protein